MSRKPWPRQSWSRTSFALFGACIFAVTLAANRASAQTILFEAERLIAGDGSTIEGAAFVVENGTITRVGRKNEVALPAGATRVDLGDKTVMPALISTHVHPGFQMGLGYFAKNFTRENIIDDLNRALYFGVSTVMSQGIERGEVMFDIRADQAAGRAGGARLLLAGRGMGAPNAGPGNPVYAGFAYSVTTEDDIRRAVQEQAARKVDAIKIWVDDRGGRAPKLPIALSRAAIEESHKHGLRVSAHIFYHDDAMELAAAGIDSFAHLVRDREMSDALVALVKKNTVFVMPNIASPERNTHTAPPPWLDEPHLAGLLRDTVAGDVIERMRGVFAKRNPATAETARKTYGNLQRSVAKLSAAGANIILGSDTGLEDHFFGYAEQKELELMVAAGMTPMQVIVAATSRGAEYLRLKALGTLAAGKRADFLVLDGNPLDNIRNTRRIAKMYIAGNEVDRAALKAELMRSR
jgi:imidazolonepropionase-like amidohydrolase